MNLGQHKSTPPPQPSMVPAVVQFEEIQI